MLCEFPNLITWMDEYGMVALHREHNERTGQLVPFSRFVELRYREDKYVWKIRMNRSAQINISMCEDGEIDEESAKLILRRMIEHCTDNGMILKVIENEDLAPDYQAALHIVEAFWSVIIPKIEKALED